MTEGDNGVLVCPVVDGMVREYQWKLNGVLSTNFNDVIADGHILKFRSISLKYDDTAIQCVVTFTSGEIEYSNNATLRGTYYYNGCSYVVYVVSFLNELLFNLV